MLIRNGQTITADAGSTLTIGAATVLVEDVNSGAAEGIVVGGTAKFTGTAIARNNNSNSSDFSQVAVNPNGRLQATNVTFDWDSVSLANGSLLSSGDMTGNVFGLTSPGTVLLSRHRCAVAGPQPELSGRQHNKEPEYRSIRYVDLDRQRQP